MTVADAFEGIQAVIVLLTQAALLLLLVQFSRPAAPRSPLFDVFNPLCFFAFFYSLYFLVPQGYGLLNDFYLVGFPNGDEVSRAEAFLQGQAAATLFLVSVTIAVAVVGRGRSAALPRTAVSAWRFPTSSIYTTRSPSGRLSTSAEQITPTVAPPSACALSGEGMLPGPAGGMSLARAGMCAWEVNLQA